ncbi:hypothetical protein U9M48_019225 [Paspalum notatum var. saurae]|uniref:Uncharacterized protein n=1 Tax=Paspalum notatum var. saurae TaxID=547442 RepID=A0AAQ3TBS1_PASNO
MANPPLRLPGSREHPSRGVEAPALCCSTMPKSVPVRYRRSSRPELPWHLPLLGLPGDLALQGGVALGHLFLLLYYSSNATTSLGENADFDFELNCEPEDDADRYGIVSSWRQLVPASTSPFLKPSCGQRWRLRARVEWYVILKTRVTMPELKSDQLYSRGVS